MLLGSISDPDTLERASKLCGTGREGDGKEPVVPPELLRQLPDWRALVIRMNLSPVVVKVRPAWRRLAYRLGRHPLPVPAYLPAPWVPAADARTRARGLEVRARRRGRVASRPPRRTATAASPGRWLRRNGDRPRPGRSAALAGHGSASR